MTNRQQKIYHVFFFALSLTFFFLAYFLDKHLITIAIAFGLLGLPYLPKNNGQLFYYVFSFVSLLLNYLDYSSPYLWAACILALFSMDLTAYFKRVKYRCRTILWHSKNT